MDGDNDEDRVGYARPPKRTQFSSNHQPTRRGRKLGARGVKTELKALLGKRVTVKIDGVATKRLPLPTLLEVQLHQALKGKERSAAYLVELILRILGSDDLGEAAKHLGPSDETEFNAFLDNYLADRAAMQPDDATPLIADQSAAPNAEYTDPDDATA
jgi:hypothetical protein